MTKVWPMGLIGIACWLAFLPVAKSQQESSGGIIAAHIRTQGFRCDDPVQAQHNVQLSMPNEQVWVLRCGNATYRVRLIPNMAAQVERLN